MHVVKYKACMENSKNSIVIAQCYRRGAPKLTFVYKQRPVYITLMGF